MAKSTYQMDAESLAFRAFGERENKDGSTSQAHVTLTGTEEGGERSAVIRVDTAVFENAVRRFVSGGLDARIKDILREVNTDVAELQARVKARMNDALSAFKGEGLSTTTEAENVADVEAEAAVETRTQAASHGHNVPAEGSRLVNTPQV